MAKAKGIRANQNFKLGKAGAKIDSRNLKLAAILKAPVTLPAEYDFDIKNPDIPLPMFANDQLGCCVISGRAHQTLRFEKVEQKKVIKITDNDVTKEYFRQTGGVDEGLIVLDSIKLWRKKGWRAAGKSYKVRAFAQINQTNRKEVKRAIYMDLGVGVGLLLPKSAEQQLNAGKPWDVVNGPSGKINSWGGHYVYVTGYTKLGPVCVTWGRKKQMTWAFVDKYCDEAYAIIDDVNTSKKKKGLSASKIEEFIAAL